jgi:outer membrane protein TolC
MKSLDNKYNVFSELTKQLVCMLIVLIQINANAQNLDDYLIMAAENNAGLKAKHFNYLAALEKVPQMKTLPDPEVSFGYFVSPIETRVGSQEARFTAVQMFPWFGTNEAKENVSVEMAKAEYYLYLQSKSDLEYQVKETYYSLYELEKSIEISNKNLDILETFEILATGKFEAGKASMVDVLRIQMEIAELENSILLLEERLVPLITVFNQYLNRDPDTKVLIPEAIEPVEILVNKQSLNDSILEKNERIKSINHMQMASEYSEKTARKNGSPSFGIGFNYVIVGERTDIDVPDNGQDAFMPMISMKIPIYRKKYKSQVREASFNIESWKNIEIEQRKSLQTQLDVALVKYSDADRRLELYSNQSETAKQTQNILIESYSTDGKDFEEILRVQKMLLNYELEIVKAARDKNTAVAKIETLY